MTHLSRVTQGRHDPGGQPGQKIGAFGQRLGEREGQDIAIGAALALQHDTGIANDQNLAQKAVDLLWSQPRHIQRQAVPPGRQLRRQIGQSQKIGQRKARGGFVKNPENGGRILDQRRGECQQMRQARRVDIDHLLDQFAIHKARQIERGVGREQARVDAAGRIEPQNRVGHGDRVAGQADELRQRQIAHSCVEHDGIGIHDLDNLDRGIGAKPDGEARHRAVEHIEIGGEHDAAFGIKADIAGHAFLHRLSDNREHLAVEQRAQPVGGLVHRLGEGQIGKGQCRVEPRRVLEIGHGVENGRQRRHKVGHREAAEIEQLVKAVMADVEQPGQIEGQVRIPGPGLLERGNRATGQLQRRRGIAGQGGAVDGGGHLHHQCPGVVQRPQTDAAGIGLFQRTRHAVEPGPALHILAHKRRGRGDRAELRPELRRIGINVDTKGALGQAEARSRPGKIHKQLEPDVGTGVERDIQRAIQRQTKAREGIRHAQRRVDAAGHRAAKADPDTAIENRHAQRILGRARKPVDRRQPDRLEVLDDLIAGHRKLGDLQPVHTRGNPGQPGLQIGGNAEIGIVGLESGNRIAHGLTGSFGIGDAVKEGWVTGDFLRDAQIVGHGLANAQQIGQAKQVVDGGVEHGNRGRQDGLSLAEIVGVFIRNRPEARRQCGNLARDRVEQRPEGPVQHELQRTGIELGHRRRAKGQVQAGAANVDRLVEGRAKIAEAEAGVADQRNVDPADTARGSPLPLHDDARRLARAHDHRHHGIGNPGIAKALGHREGNAGIRGQQPEA